MPDTQPHIINAHIIDDLVTYNGKARQTARQTVELLELGLHALRHGRLAVADEYMDRAAETLRKIT